MKKHTKWLVAIVAAFAMVSALAFAGCSSNSGSSSSSSNSSSSSSSEQASSSNDNPVELQIFAANSLEKALPEVQALYTQQHPNVTFSDTQFKASGDLVSQLQQSSTAADVLITASSATMDTAAKNGSIDESTRKDMFNNDLVVCAAENSSIQVKDLNDLNTDAISSFALGDPATVPAGKYAAQSLQSAGLCTLNDDNTITWSSDALKAKANAGADKVGTVAKYVSQGDAQVGFVYSSDIYRYDGIKTIYTVPSDMHKAIKYPGAVCKDTQHAQEAADFINFCMTDADAQQIFSKYGFELAS